MYKICYTCCINEYGVCNTVLEYQCIQQKTTEYIVLSYTVKESCRTYTSAEFCPQHRNNFDYSASVSTKKNLEQS